jgi:glyoxalase family protein
MSETSQPSSPLEGIHHVTAITGDPQGNIDFYTGVLGLRLVKLTVNFDDPGSYHFYYGDAMGHPGTILTFFAWPGAPRGRQGTGQIAAIAFSIPANALGYWVERLAGKGISVEGPTERLAAQSGARTLAFMDPDGLPLELVSHPAAEARSDWTAWVQGPVPEAEAIRGLHSVTLWETSAEQTAAFLARNLGFRPLEAEGTVSSYALGAGGPGTLLDLRVMPDSRRGIVASGTVHHVAWRTPSDADQVSWQEDLLVRGRHDVTQVLDREYFHSIYFHEPGGILFEIATDPPGFTVDEPFETLGTTLRLPPWLESQRQEIERHLPSLRLPDGTQSPSKAG